MKIVLALGLGIGILWGCGDKDDDTPAVATVKGSCDTPTMSGYKMCHDFSGFSQTALDAAESGCTGGNFGTAGTFTSGTLCSTTGIVGTCTWTSGGDTIKTIYTAPDAAAAQSHCEDSGSGWGGTWVGT